MHGHLVLQIFIQKKYKFFFYTSLSNDKIMTILSLRKNRDYKNNRIVI
jgi:hypothetical protein